MALPRFLFYGYSHFNQLLDQLMREWNTPDRVCDTLRQCEQNGINAFQYGHNERPFPIWNAIARMAEKCS